MRQADEKRLEEQIEAGEMPPEARLDLPLPRLSYVSNGLEFLTLCSTRAYTATSTVADR